MRFTRAIVRGPGPDFATGLTTAGLGAPSYDLALEQHERYCAALERCGLEMTRLQALPGFPDSTFVEDTAVVTARGAMLARPGAPSRLGEVDAIRDVLARFDPAPAAIEAPGTLDGGDVCEADGRFFIGVSERTNEAGARQLAGWLEGIGYSAILVDVRGVQGLLHLKSGLGFLGAGRIAAAFALADRSEFDGFEIVRLEAGEEYAANCMRVNEIVLVASGHPEFESRLKRLGFQVILLDMSEFRKMDGGLSCLSLRF